MLGSDYTEHLQRLIDDICWSIELPAGMENFFRETGPLPSMAGDERKAARLRVRAKSVAISEVRLHAWPRQTDPYGVYISDISRYGVGFLSAEQFFPEEQVRLILPAFWLVAQVARVRKLGPNCYQIGARLLRRNDPNMTAFDVQQTELTEAVLA